MFRGLCTSRNSPHASSSDVDLCHLPRSRVSLPPDTVVNCDQDGDIVLLTAEEYRLTEVPLLTLL